jgi:DNA sulfur modification protein DndE
VTVRPSIGPLLTSVYVSSKEGEVLLKRLTRAGGFTADNVISRLAIARSLAERGSAVDPSVYGEPTGKQIRGSTLLGRREVASALVAMVVEREGGARREEDVKRLIRFHWERGLRLMVADLADGDLTSVLVSYAQQAVLAESSPRTRRSRAAATSVDGAVVGQVRLRGELRPLLAEAEATEPPHLPRPMLLLGPPGQGKRHIARAIAATLQLPLTEALAANAGRATLIRTIDEQLASQGYGVENDGQAVIVPPSITYVAGADELPEEDLAYVIRALCTSRQEKVILRGGGLILGTSNRIASRKCERFELDPYTRDEVAEILRREIGSFPLEVRRYLALAGRLNPGQALERASEFLKWARDAKRTPSEGLVLELMEKRWQLDRLGLTEEDYSLLASLTTEPGSTPPATLAFLERLQLIRKRGSAWRRTPRGEQALTARELQ